MQLDNENVVSTLCFSQEDQEWFARFSGDKNPIHLEQSAALCAAFEAVVVHGMHVVISMLDNHFASRTSKLKLNEHSRLRVVFSKPTFNNEELQLIQGYSSDGGLTMTVGSGDTVMTRLRFMSAQTTKSIAPFDKKLEPVDLPNQPDDPDFTKADHPEGRLDQKLPLAELEARFPHVCEYFGAQTVADLARISTVVGMIWPGLRSLFVDLDITFAPNSSANGLSFRVVDTNLRHSITHMEFASRTFTAVAMALIRPHTVKHPGTREFISLVNHDEFANQVALIVGGSRGVGEVTAKLLTAGGGTPIITYHSNAERAELVAADIRNAGGKCRVARLDVTEHGSLSDRLDISDVNTLYYYASPPIFRRRTGIYDPKFFANFCAAYVNDFFEFITSVRQATQAQSLRIFYPSTVALDEQVPQIVEYAMAKAAGETLCTQLDQKLPGIKFVIARLSRMRTDQTNTIVRPDESTVEDAILPWLRRMSGPLD